MVVGEGVINICIVVVFNVEDRVVKFFEYEFEVFMKRGFLCG